MTLDPDDRQFLDDAKRIVRELNQWADGKIASGVPGSPAEAQTIDSLKASLRELRRRLDDLKRKV